MTTRYGVLPDAPHHRYFRAKDGYWWGKIRFELTDPRGLRASNLRLADKWAMRFLSMASRMSALVLTTTVDSVTRGHFNEVLHTTRVANLGVPIYRSAETFLLGDDGHSFRVAGREAFFPFLRWAAWAATGTVATDHNGAAYQIPWFGLTMEQTTRMTAEGLEITQRSPFSRAAILLKWQRPLPAKPAAANTSAGP